MKILYIKLTNGYKEDFTYQENVLPAKFVNLGYESHIIVSRRSRDASGNRILVESCQYKNDKDVIVHVLPFSKKFSWLSKKFDRYDSLRKKMEEISPDIIFVHSLQFLSVLDVAKFKQRHPNVKLYVDNHADYNIMPLDTIKRKIIQKGLYRFLAKRICSFVDCFYGVAPMRATYLHEVYDIPNEKIRLITQGGDEAIVSSLNRDKERKFIYDKFQIPQTDKLIVSGAGNIDNKKKIHELLKAVSAMSGYSLVLFGTFTQKEKIICEEYLSAGNIHYIGRIPGVESYNYFVAADLVIFPGQHSVLWDQSVACGVPSIFRWWQGLDYFNIDGNCIYLQDGSAEEIGTILVDLMNNDKLKKLQLNAQGKSKQEFSYIAIARKILMSID